MNKKILSKTNNSGLTIYVTHHEFTPNYMWRGAYSAQASDANAGHAIYIRLGEYVDPERELKPALSNEFHHAAIAKANFANLDAKLIPKDIRRLAYPFIDTKS